MLSFIQAIHLRRHAVVYQRALTSHRPSSRTRGRSWARACAQPPKSEEEDADGEYAELDAMADAWIRGDVSRWEWYERMKSRRKSLLNVVRQREVELDEDFEELRQTFMEFDQVFGTHMIDESSRVSNVGWAVVACIVLGYVVVGYVVVDFLVGSFTSASSWLG